MNQTTTLKLFSNIFILRKKENQNFVTFQNFIFGPKIFLEKSDFDFLNPIFNFFEKKFKIFEFFVYFYQFFLPKIQNY